MSVGQAAARQERFEELFASALDGNDEERVRLLDRLGDEDPALAHELRSLILSYDPAFLATLPDAASMLTEIEEAEEDPAALGEEIGGYRILRLIGQGGVAQVYEAEQLRPLRRRVAIKFLQARMDGGRVALQFQAERQALALMDHPAVCKVFDAGTTASGRPYFVMEYVDGVPITRYASAHGLSLDARLRMFVDVCGAVQHAHQRGLIHRDLKPGNVLVGEHEGQPRSKVIDFGVAKAMGVRLLDQTLPTESGLVIGTPEYMSPEQIDASGGAVDTRADVYALGVTLYELLTGSLPHGSRDGGPMSLYETLRSIREVEPRLPSARLRARASLIGAEDPERSEALRRARALAGDLDSIVMQALAKRPDDRYASVADLSRDLESYIEGRPVTARPLSLPHRWLKFARRHLLGTAVAAAVLVLTVAFATILALQARNIVQQRDRAEGAANRLRVLLEQWLVESMAPPEHASGPGIDAPVRIHVATELQRRMLAEAEKDLAALSGDPMEAELQSSLARIHATFGNHERAIELMQAAIQARGRDPLTAPIAIADSLSQLADWAYRAARYDDAVALANQALALRRSASPVDLAGVARDLRRRAFASFARGQAEAAQGDLHEAIETWDRVWGPVNPEHAARLDDLAELAWRRGQSESAKELLEEATSHWAEAIDEGYPQVILDRAMLTAQDQPADAVRLLRGWLEFEGLADYLERRSPYLLSEHPAFAPLQQRSDFVALLDRYGVERPPAIRFRSPASGLVVASGDLIAIEIVVDGGTPTGPVVLSSASGFERVFTEPPYTAVFRVPGASPADELRLRATTQDALGRRVESTLTLPIEPSGATPDREAPREGAAVFAPALSTKVGAFPGGLAAGDIDLDGVLDLAVVQGRPARVVVLLGHGDGTFRVANRVIVSPSSKLGPLALADLDHNGVLDVVVGSAGYGNRVFVLFGRGDGTFEAPRHSRVGGNHRDVALADVDGDGRTDIAVANGFNYPAAVLYGSGGGVFEPARELPGGVAARWLAVGDVNLDGIQDLVALPQYQRGLALWIDGRPRGSSGPVAWEPSKKWTSFTLGDLNRDTYPDLVTADTEALHFFAGDGRGGFAPLADYGLCALVACGDTLPIIHLKSRDLDADGLPDIVAVGYLVHVFRSTPDGQLQVEKCKAGSAPGQVLVEDFNGDSISDLAVTGEGSGTVEVLLGLP